MTPHDRTESLLAALRALLAVLDANPGYMTPEQQSAVFAARQLAAVRSTP